MTLFGDSVFKEEKLNEVTGVALIQDDWCFYKRRILGHRKVQREDHVMPQEGDSHLQAKDEA